MDLFEHYELLPKKVKKVLDKYFEAWGETYDECRAMLKDVEAIGYTFEYYLDATPYNLRRMVKVGELYFLDELSTLFLDEGLCETDFVLTDNEDFATIQHKTKPDFIKLSFIGKQGGSEDKKVYECIHSDIDKFLVE